MSVRIAFLVDWCRRDPAVGYAQMEREDEAMRAAVKEQLLAGPRYPPNVWEELRRMKHADRVVQPVKGRR